MALDLIRKDAKEQTSAEISSDLDLNLPSDNPFYDEGIYENSNIWLQYTRVGKQVIASVAFKVNPAGSLITTAELGSLGINPIGGVVTESRLSSRTAAGEIAWRVTSGGLTVDSENITGEIGRQDLTFIVAWIKPVA